MRKDAISQSAINAARLIYAEHGHHIVDYSHAPTDYARGTVEEPESTGKLKEAFHELLPGSRNADFNALNVQEEGISRQIDLLQDQMRMSRQRGSFQMLQAQMKKMNMLIKEREKVNAAMAVQNLAATQLQTGDFNEFSELAEIGEQINRLEKMILEYTETL